MANDVTQSMNPEVPLKEMVYYGRLQTGCSQPKKSMFTDCAYQLARLWSKRSNQQAKAMKVLTWAMVMTKEDAYSMQLLGIVRDEVQRKITAQQQRRQKKKENEAESVDRDDV